MSFPPWRAALSVLGLIALSPSLASACSTVPSCEPPVRLFPSGPVPGNLVYFKVVHADAPPPRLRTRDGAVVPASVRTIGRDTVFAPNEEVPAGQELVLEYDTVCPLAAYSPSLKSTVQTFAFSTSASVALPETVHASLVVLDTLTTEGNSFDGPELVVSARARYTAPNTPGVAHLVDHHATIDGQHVLIGKESPALIEARSLCGGLVSESSCGGFVYFPLGNHEVEAWSTIVGAPDAPEHLRVRLTTSGAACGEGCSLASARAPGRGAVDLLLGWLLALTMSYVVRRLAHTRAAAR